jgi:hypothetical protein
MAFDDFISKYDCQSFTNVNETVLQFARYRYDSTVLYRVS